MQGVTNNLIGLSSVLIQANNPQIVRVITLKHIFSVIEKELNLSKAINVDVFVRTLREAQANNLNDTSLISMLKNQKLTATLEQQTRITLYNLGIISK